MKRVTKEIKKRTFAMVNAFPRFVSVVDRGANLIPLSKLQYSEDETAKFNDVEINRIEFSNEKFKDKASVEDYLTSNGYEEFSIEETATGWFVPGVETDLFEDVSNIEYDDGVMYFIGKLKQESEDAPVANIVESDIAAPADKEVYTEGEAEVTSEESVEEVVTESEDAPVEEIKDEQEAETQVAQAEEIVTEDVGLADRIAAATITASEIAVGTISVENIVDNTVATQEIAGVAVTTENLAVEQHSEDENRDRASLISSAKFGSDYADFKHQLQEAQEQNVIFTFDYLAYLFMDTSYSAVREGDMPQLKKNCLAFYSAMDALLTASKNLSFSEATDEVDEVENTDEPAKFSMTKNELELLIAEKLEQFKQKEVKPVDNEVVLMQNSQRIKTDDLVVETAEKEVDPQVAKFNEDKIKDLFGIR